MREAKESLKSAPGSEIRFYRNGKSLGQAFADINDGIYYPAVSLYRGAKVKIKKNNIEKETFSDKFWATNGKPFIKNSSIFPEMTHRSEKSKCKKWVQSLNFKL